MYTPPGEGDRHAYLHIRLSNIINAIHIFPLQEARSYKLHIAYLHTSINSHLRNLSNIPVSTYAGRKVTHLFSYTFSQYRFTFHPMSSSSSFSRAELRFK